MDRIYQLKYLCSIVLHLRDVYVLVFTAFPPYVWDSVFFRAEMFGLPSLLLPLLYWSQGFGYGFLA